MNEPERDSPVLSRRKALARMAGAVPLAAGAGAAAAATGSNSWMNAVLLLLSDDDTSTGTSVSSDAALGALALSSGSLSPAFAAATNSYTVSVANAVSTIALTPTVSNAAATIAINGTTVASGSASNAISLSVGTTAITIVVTAADNATTRTYGIAVTRAAATSVANCALIPQETQGPYPLLAILSNSALVRQDIRETKTGVPLTLTLTLSNVNNSCLPITNAGVYIWHCDRSGEYSGYSSNQNGSHLGETFLRGIQVSDSNGQVTFTTIYPGWYIGRVTHIHVQVYLNDNLAASATATTQLAFPPAVTTAVYNTSLYSAHGQNTSVATFAADNVFSDGTSYQLLTLTGDTVSGYSAALNIGIAV